MIFIFATKSRYLTTPPTISRMKMVTLSMYFNVKMTVRCEDAYQSVSVAVGKELSCQLKGGSIRSCGDERQVIVGREKFQQFARCMDNIVRGVLYYPCSMVL